MTIFVQTALCPRESSYGKAELLGGEKWVHLYVWKLLQKGLPRHSDTLHPQKQCPRGFHRVTRFCLYLLCFILYINASLLSWVKESNTKISVSVSLLLERPQKLMSPSPPPSPPPSPLQCYDAHTCPSTPVSLPTLACEGICAWSWLFACLSE